MAAGLLHRLLAHPLTASFKPDDPRTTELRRQIIKTKPFLKAIYQEWYERLAAGVPQGTGAGFLSQYIPGLLTSEVFPCSNVDMVLNAQCMPFEMLPEFEIEQIEPFLPFRYLLSGGVSMRALMPGFTHGAWAWVEQRLSSQMRRLGMFAFLAVRKR